MSVTRKFLAAIILLLAFIFALPFNMSLTDTDGDGILDDDDKCENTPANAYVDEYGCSCGQKNCAPDNNVCTDDCGGPNAKCNYPNKAESEEKITCPQSRCEGSLLHEYPASVSQSYCSDGNLMQGECKPKVYFSNSCTTPQTNQTVNISRPKQYCKDSDGNDAFSYGYAQAFEGELLRVTFYDSCYSRSSSGRLGQVSACEGIGCGVREAICGDIYPSYYPSFDSMIECEFGCSGGACKEKVDNTSKNETPKEYRCMDSDSGLNYEKRGAVLLCSNMTDCTDLQDSCNGNILAEGYCAKRSDGTQYIGKSNHSCQYGCLDGACLPTDRGSLFVASNPSGADVYVDNHDENGYKGKTPLTISELLQGSHEVWIENPIGGDAARRIVNIIAAKTTDLQVNFANTTNTSLYQLFYLKFNGNYFTEDGREPIKYKTSGLFSNEAIEGQSLGSMKALEYLQYSCSKAFNPAAGTLSTWINFDEITDDDAVIFHSDDARFALYYDSYYDGSAGRRTYRITFRAGDSTDDNPKASYFIDADPAWKTDEWHHVAARWKGMPAGTATLFIDGKSVDSITYSDSKGCSDFRIGNNYGWLSLFPWQEWRDGIIDEFKLYRRALTESEILEEYHSVTKQRVNATMQIEMAKDEFEAGEVIELLGFSPSSSSSSGGGGGSGGESTTFDSTSFIMNNEQYDLSGYLYLALHKYVNDSWKLHKVVLDDYRNSTLRVIGAGMSLDLAPIWNDLGIKIYTNGTYKAYAEFLDTDNRLYRTHFGNLSATDTFQVVPKITPFIASLTYPLPYAEIPDEEMKFSLTTTRPADCKYYYTKRYHLSQGWGTFPEQSMQTVDGLSHEAAFDISAGYIYTIISSCRLRANVNMIANASVIFSAIATCGNNLCEFGENTSSCHIDCRYVNYSEANYCGRDPAGGFPRRGINDTSTAGTLEIQSGFSSLTDAELDDIVIQGDIRKFKQMGLTLHRAGPNRFSAQANGQRISILNQDLPEIASLQDSNGNKFVINLAKVFKAEYSDGYIVRLADLPVIEYKGQLEDDIRSRKERAEKLEETIQTRTGISRLLNIIDGPRLALSRNAISSKENKLPSLITEHSEDLASAQDNLKKKIAGELGPGKVRKSYTKAFNGFYFDGTAQEAQQLAKMRGIKAVAANRKVNLLLDKSAKVINADDVWRRKDHEGKNITGKGIKVAVIDTGVDYMHPDLGGCFGEGCKVAAGYDLINEDNDPIDDQGHGTHVAATIAGNHQLYQGIAPDATIYAYKVLNEDGSGSWASVIGGIERAVDPNLDGNFSDHVDIISMSLGGFGDPDDPVSTAADNAVRAGVITVIAAGNDYAYGSIGSPGTSRLAITVAATDKCDELAEFSSKGPVIWSNGTILKPDISAPGVSICAAQYDGWLDTTHSCGNPEENHIAISGTSMATPHVAGVASLLKQARPGISTEEMKSLLKQTSYNIGYNFLEQGTGRIDAQRAMDASLLITPANFDLDVSYTGQASLELKVKNIHSEQKNLSFQYPRPYMLKSYDIRDIRKIPLVVDGPHNLSVDAESEIIIPLSIDFLPEWEGFIFGSVRINDGSNIYTIPYMISRFYDLTIDVDTAGVAKDYDVFVDRDDLSFSTGSWNGGKIGQDKYRFRVFSGNYTIAVAGDYSEPGNEYLLFDRAYVAPQSSALASISYSDARPYTIKARDLNDNPLFLVLWDKKFTLYNGQKVRSFTMGDPTIGDRTVYVTNKPQGGPDLDILFDYKGVPYDEKYVPKDRR